MTCSCDELGQLDLGVPIPEFCQVANPGSLTPEMQEWCEMVGGGWPELPPVPSNPPTTTPPVLPTEIPPVVPPGTIPAGLVTEQQCRERNAAAYEDGKAAERRNVLMTAAISAGVTALVAGLVGYAIGQ